MSDTEQSLCSRCKGNVIMVDSELCCSKCGMVVDQSVIDFTRDFKWTDPEKTTHGSPTLTTMHDMGLSTTIDHRNKDATGKAITNNNMKGTLNRMRTWNSRMQVQSSTDRNLKLALTDLNKFQDKLNIPDPVIEKAAWFYRKILEKRLTRGRTITTMMASALYVAIRESLTPRTLNDIAEITLQHKKDISANFRLIVKELDLKLPVPNAISYTSRIASFLKPPIPEKVVRYAKGLLEQANKDMVNQGKDPIGFAASALYVSCIVCGFNNITQRAVSNAANITEVTIRNRYKDLLKYVDENDIQDKIRKQPTGTYTDTLVERKE